MASAQQNEIRAQIGQAGMVVHFEPQMYEIKQTLRPLTIIHNHQYQHKIYRSSVFQQSGGEVMADLTKQSESGDFGEQMVVTGEQMVNG